MRAEQGSPAQLPTRRPLGISGLQSGWDHTEMKAARRLRERGPGLGGNESSPYDVARTLAEIRYRRCREGGGETVGGNDTNPCKFCSASEVRSGKYAYGEKETN